MRCLSLLLVASCGSSTPTPVPAPKPQPPEEVKPAKPIDTPAPMPAIKREVMAADTPRTTVAGNTFIAPKEWAIWVKGPATILQAPEGDSRVAFVDVQAKDADAAVELAWAAYKPAKTWKVETSSEVPSREGWSKMKEYSYQTSPAESRSVGAFAAFANDTWSVVIVDLAHATAGKRGGQLGLIFGQFLPKGGAKESFAGKKAHPLDKDRIAKLTAFVEDSMKTLGVPGVSIGLVEKGKVVFSGGFGVRQLGKPAKPDGDTRYMIASSTKPLTTLMLAKLVDAKKLAWDMPAVTAMPSFKRAPACRARTSSGSSSSRTAHPRR